MGRADANATSTNSTCEGGAKVWVPPGLKARHVGSNTLRIFNNDQYRYLGVDLDGNLVPGLAGAALSCTCTAGSGGCSPGQSGDTKACIFGQNCTACSGSVSGLIPGDQAGEYQTVPLRSGGFVGTNVEVHYATRKELNEQPSGFSAMGSDRSIRRALRKFQDANGGTANPASALVSVVGRIVVLEVDADVAAQSNAKVLAAKGACACTDGTCPYKKIIGVGEGCDASDCKGTCSLSTGIISNGDTAEYLLSPY
jgi:hypothetical protein